MPPAVLIVGATGNTGRSVTENLPSLLASEKQHAIQPPTQLEYVVRISTTAANVRPDCKAYYSRKHWAIESLVGSPEFQSMQWTSLQPNVFSRFYLSSVAEFIQNYRRSGVRGPLRLHASKDGPVGIIDSTEVGNFAAHLLGSDDPAAHNKAKYVLNGPEDIAGAQIVDLVEQHTGLKLKDEDVTYKDLASLADSYYDYQWAQTGEVRNVITSIKYALETGWHGECTASTTSKEVLELAAPKRTPAEVLRDLLSGQ